MDAGEAAVADEELTAGETGSCEELSDFDKGQIYIARRLGLSISETAKMVGCSESAVANEDKEPTAHSTRLPVVPLPRKPAPKIKKAAPKKTAKKRREASPAENGDAKTDQTLKVEATADSE